MRPFYVASKSGQGSCGYLLVPLVLQETKVSKLQALAKTAWKDYKIAGLIMTGSKGEQQLSDNLLALGFN